MASLTHVFMFSEHGWKRITANEAARLHPGGTVSAKSGLFVCRLCGQYVGLTYGKNNVRHFKHSRGEKSKNCPERTFGPSVCIDYNARAYELPIRIRNITENQFELELGLLYVPQSILQAQKMQQVIIQPLESEDAPYVYSFARLNPETLTYVYIGNIPAPRYKLSVSSELRCFWPQYVSGIERSGSIFVQKTGKKLPEGADVQVGNCYYLLCAKRIRVNSSNIMIERICENKVSRGIWYLYEVRATVFAEDSVQFFLDYGFFLTESRLSLNPIWPIYTETPYVIQHNRDQLFMYLHRENDDDVVEKVFPATTIKDFSCLDGKVIRIDCNERQQLISVGRTKVLEYTYFWKNQLNKTTSKPAAEVLDINGNALVSGVQRELPKQRILCVTVPYDGAVIILEHGHVTEKRILKAEQRTELNDIRWGTEIKVLQGLDLVWSARYERTPQKMVSDDIDISRRLKSFKGRQIPLSHSVGSSVGRLKNYPEVKKWLYETIRDGYISEDAFRFFKHFMERLQYKM